MSTGRIHGLKEKDRARRDQRGRPKRRRRALEGPQAEDERQRHGGGGRERHDENAPQYPNTACSPAIINGRPGGYKISVKRRS